MKLAKTSTHCTTMFKKFCISLTVCFFGFTYALTASLPEYFKKCHVDDLDCLKKSVYLGLFYMKNGIPELGVPPIDPMKNLTFTIQPGQKLFQAEMRYKNTFIAGQSTAIVKEIVFNLKTKQFKLILEIPHFTLEGDYDVRGKLLGQEVKSHGRMIFSADDFISSMQCKLENLDKEGETFLKISECDDHFELSYLSYNMTSLPRKLNRQLLHNQAEILREIEPNYRQPLAALKMNLINQFFEKIPVSGLFA